MVFSGYKTGSALVRHPSRAIFTPCAVNSSTWPAAGERVGNVADDAARVLRIDRAMVVNALGEIIAVDERHHEEIDVASRDRTTCDRSSASDCEILGSLIM